MSNRLLMDTHVWVWLLSGDSRLSTEATEALSQTATQGGLLVAAISLWEIAMLAAKSRIVLSLPCAQWLNQALALPGTSLTPLSAAIAAESVSLPGAFHGDPADRLIVATARVVGVTLATRDERILAYGELGHVRTLAV